MEKQNHTEFSQPSALKASGLAIGYRDKVLAENLKISVRPGEVAALLGRNGIGKSTLLKTLTGELPPIRGTVEVCGRPLASLSRKEMAKMMAVVSTERVDAGALTVEELVSLGRHPYTGFFGGLGNTDRNAVDEAMESTGIAYKRNAFVATLSDGERQKAMIARALAQQTPVLALDEPFSFLAVASRVGILAMLKRVASDRGLAVLFTSHDVAQALRMADRVWVFSHDRRLSGGTPQEMIDSGAIETLFADSEVRFNPSQFDFVETDGE